MNALMLAEEQFIQYYEMWNYTRGDALTRKDRAVKEPTRFSESIDLSTSSTTYSDEALKALLSAPPNRRLYQRYTPPTFQRHEARICV